MCFRISGKPADKSARQRLADLVAPHVESFDYLLDEGLRKVVAALESHEVERSGDGPSLRFWFESIAVARPTRNEPGSLDVKPLFPSECRERGISYRGTLHITLCCQVDAEDPERIARKLGLFPVMVRSRRCNLRGVSSEELMRRGEEGSEVGGYFVCNGNERAIRLLIAPKRNLMMGISRPSFKNRGADFTQFAVSIRCVRPDGTSQTVALHLLTGGGAKLRVTISKQVDDADGPLMAR